MNNAEERPTLKIAARSPDQKKRSTVGHEIPLAAAINNRRVLRFDLGDAGVISGVVTAFDKYSVTVRHADGSPETVFKHAIRRFRAETDDAILEAFD